MTEIYSNLLVQYLYDDTNEIVKSGVKCLLKRDYHLRCIHDQLMQSRNFIEQNIQLQHPKKLLVENILRYAVR